MIAPLISPCHRPISPAPTARSSPDLLAVDGAHRERHAAHSPRRSLLDARRHRAFRLRRLRRQARRQRGAERVDTLRHSSAAQPPPCYTAPHARRRRGERPRLAGVHLRHGDVCVVDALARRHRAGRACRPLGHACRLDQGLPHVIMLMMLMLMMLMITMLVGSTKVCPHLGARARAISARARAISARGPPLPPSPTHILPPAPTHHFPSICPYPKVYYYGGYGIRYGYSNDTFILDTALLSWSRPYINGTPPAPRVSHGRRAGTLLPRSPPDLPPIPPISP